MQKNRISGESAGASIYLHTPPCCFPDLLIWFWQWLYSSCTADPIDIYSSTVWYLVGFLTLFLLLGSSDQGVVIIAHDYPSPGALLFLADSPEPRLHFDKWFLFIKVSKIEHLSGIHFCQDSKQSVLPPLLSNIPWNSPPVIGKLLLIPGLFRECSLSHLAWKLSQDCFQVHFP